MERYLNSPQPKVLPRPIVVPEPETVPLIEPDEDDPFNVPGPLVDPTPKGIKEIKKTKKLFKFCNIYLL